MGFFKYIKAAFSNKWHMLALAGSTGFAILTGHAEVAVPLVLAAEVGYLSLLGTHEKFQKHVDAQEHKQARAATNKDAKRSVRQIMFALPRQSKNRYKNLAERCRKLRQLSESLHSDSSSSLHQQQLEGLDRLLWMYLKLLYTEYCLEQFLESTDESRIKNEVAALKARIEREQSRPHNEQRERILNTLQDDLKTCESRQVNYRKADENHELVQLETRRLENKIHSLSELAINRKEPNFVSDQVDEVAGGMLSTEKTLNDLEFITGLHTEHDEPVPELVRRDRVRTRR